jgi:hypothetical protein
MHYSRWLRNGTTDPRPVQTCAVETCNRPSRARGWCRSHWERWRRHGDPLVVLRDLNPDRSARFSAKVDRSGGPDACWPWRGFRDPKDYGHFFFDGAYVYAHREAWAQANGLIPEGLCILHRCDNPPCCNPAHLWPGTKAENNADKAAKGRCPEQPRTTQCPRGHEFTRTAKSKYCGPCQNYRAWARRRGVPYGTPRPVKPKPRCTVSGCTGKHLAKGYCGRHYQRVVKFGTPLPPGLPR